MIQLHIKEEVKNNFFIRNKVLKTWYDTPFTKEYMYFDAVRSKLMFSISASGFTYKYELPVETDGSTISKDDSHLYNLSLSKFLNGISKFNNVIIKLEENVITFTDGSVSVITMPVNSIAEASEIINTVFYKPFESNSATDPSYDKIVLPRTVFEKFYPMFYPNMENVEKKNSLIVDRSGLIYGDKVFLIKKHIEDIVFEPVLLNKEFLAIYFSLMMKLNEEFGYSYNSSKAYWNYSDDVGSISIAFQLSQDQSEVAIPITDAGKPEFFDGIAPSANSVDPNEVKAIFTTTVEEVLEVIDFFNGFYENVIWKPITFDFANGQNGIITKFVNSSGSNTSLVKAFTTVSYAYHEGGTEEFMLAIDYIKNVVSQLKTDDVVEFCFTNDKPGVRMICGDIDCCFGIFVN